MVNNGVVEQVYRVLDPSMKVLLPETYRNRSQIPSIVPNNWDESIEVVQENIRLVLLPVTQ
jgi:hypothetical protein